jgi:hypothetical protein
MSLHYAVLRWCIEQLECRPRLSEVDALKTILLQLVTSAVLGHGKSDSGLYCHWPGAAAVSHLCDRSLGALHPSANFVEAYEGSTRDPLGPAGALLCAAGAGLGEAVFCNCCWLRTKVPDKHITSKTASTYLIDFIVDAACCFAWFSTRSLDAQAKQYDSCSAAQDHHCALIVNYAPRWCRSDAQFPQMCVQVVAVFVRHMTSRALWTRSCSHITNNKFKLFA